MATGMRKDRPGRPGRPPARVARRPSGPRRSGGDAGAEGLWLFGLHAVRDALSNPARRIKRLLLTPNALQKLEETVATAKIEPEMQDPRKFAAPLDPASVHQGAALETDPLDWGALSEVCALRSKNDAPSVLLLDRVTDPHNVGAILRSAEVFGARAVIAPHRHSAPETGALAKAASGALERQPYLRVPNLARAMAELQELGFVLVGLDGAATMDLDDALEAARTAPLGLALGAEGPGLRELTRTSCDAIARIPCAADFASLNVSNAAAVSLYAAARGRRAD